MNRYPNYRLGVCRACGGPLGASSVLYCDRDRRKNTARMVEFMRGKRADMAFRARENRSLRRRMRALRARRRLDHAGATA